MCQFLAPSGATLADGAYSCDFEDGGLGMAIDWDTMTVSDIQPMSQADTLGVGMGSAITSIAGQAVGSGMAQEAVVAIITSSPRPMTIEYYRGEVLPTAMAAPRAATPTGPPPIDLKPLADDEYAAVFDEKGGGLGVAVDWDELHVTQVVPGGRAEDHGVVVGDTLERVNSAEVTPASGAAAVTAMIQHAAYPMTLVFKRASRPTLTPVASVLMQAPSAHEYEVVFADGGLGIAVDWDNLHVTEIQAGGQGDSLGVTSGSTIVNIAGNPVDKEMGSEAIIALITGSPRPLAVVLQRERVGAAPAAAPAARVEYAVSFADGGLGIAVDWDNLHVTEIQDGGQGAALGVTAGSTIVNIAGSPVSTEMGSEAIIALITGSPRPLGMVLLRAA